MARVKISEFQAKNLLQSNYLGLPATSATTAKEIQRHFPNQNLVVKVDQGIKKRGKLGLVKVNLSPRDIPPILKGWAKLRWSSFLIEPVVEHAPEAEHYLALERERDGWLVSYSEKGGIDVESSWEMVQRTVLRFEGLTLMEVPNPTDIFNSREGQTLKDFVISLIPLLDANHISFLEMNPIIVRKDSLIPLDMACEADSAGTTLPYLEDRALSDSEKAVAVLDATTPASLKFKLINPEGHIWMLLSGGGASLVLADEVADQGMGADLANYGEYSGAPTDDDVYSYTKIIITTMLHRPSTIDHRPLALVIAGGVANFTDVAKTFKGIIKAMGEVKSELCKAKVKVFVRRGGPNEKKGLDMMKEFLDKSNLLGSVHGHDIALTKVIDEIKEYLVGADLCVRPHKRNI